MWKKRLKKGEKKSPLKDRPLPQAGDSLYEEMLDRIFDVIALWVAVFTVLFMMMLFAWIQWFTGKAMDPYFATLITIPGGGYALYRLWRIRRDVENMRLGLRGEIVVAQEIQESLPLLGYRLIHDIPGDGFNVDHVAIGPRGILAIETKTVSKPVDRNAQIFYDGATVKIDGAIPDKNPLDQAAGAAKFIAQKLYEQTGTRPFVQGVVLYPGWFVNVTVPNPVVLVHNPKHLLPVVRRRPVALSEAEVVKFTEGLKRYVRSQSEELV